MNGLIQEIGKIDMEFAENLFVSATLAISVALVSFFVVIAVCKIRELLKSEVKKWK